MVSERRSAQIHVRISPALKRALKMHCVRRDVTEQQRVGDLVEMQLASEAPDLWQLDAEEAAVDRGGRR